MIERAPSRGSRVLFALGPTSGGIGRHVEALAAALHEQGWQVHVLGPDLARLTLPEGVICHEAPLRRPRGLAEVRALRALSRLARDVDVVHAHGLTAGWLAAGARWGSGRRPRTPLVVTVHNLVLAELGGPGRGFRRHLEGRLPRVADRVVAVSTVVARRFTGVRGASRIRVVAPLAPIPVPTVEATVVRQDLGIAVGAPLVVCVARLHPQKDLPTLLAATQRLSDVVEGVRVVIVGDGPDRRALEAEVARRGLGSVVLLTGQRRDTADVLAAADVVVSCARWESVGLVVLEALALGRPVVATPVGVAPDVIRDGWSGWLVPVGDAPGLATRLQAVLADPAGSERVAEEGRRAVAAWSDPGEELDGLLTVYRELGVRVGAGGEVG